MALDQLRWSNARRPLEPVNVLCVHAQQPLLPRQQSEKAVGEAGLDGVARPQRVRKRPERRRVIIECFEVKEFLQDEGTCDGTQLAQPLW